MWKNGAGRTLVEAMAAWLSLVGLSDCITANRKRLLIDSHDLNEQLVYLVMCFVVFRVS